MSFDYNHFLPLEKLDHISSVNSQSYQDAYPYAHGVFDDVFNTSMLDTIISEFEESTDNWHQFESKFEKKFQMSSDRSLKPITRAFIHHLNSEPFLRFLEDLTGIKGLIPDPYLQGAGLHRISRGGKLGVHVDFNTHTIMNVYRRLNVLIYLNKDWQETWGGHFELWDKEHTSCQKKVLPTYNRMTIFSTTSSSYHGHPEPLNCPEDKQRLSLALYYYTANNIEGQANHNHSTLFLNENGTIEEPKYNSSVIERFKSKVKDVLRK